MTDSTDRELIISRKVVAQNVQILYFVDQYPKLSASFVINEIKELSNRGHDITIFAKSSGDENIEHEEVEDIEAPIYYSGTPDYRSILDLFDRRVLNRRVMSNTLFFDKVLDHARYLYYAKHISKVLDNEDIDLIQSHFAVPDRIAMTYVADRYGTPCTVTAHAYDIFSSPDIPMLRRICNNVDYVIVPSEYNKLYLLNDVEINNRIGVVPATTDLEKFGADDVAETEERILTVARLVEKKGHEFAIRAVAELLDEGHEINYYIVGKGDRRSYLEKEVKKVGIEESVYFLGHVPDSRLRDELGRASIFLLPCVVASDGDRDAMPVVLKEAMASKTVCVSTTVSAIPELITDGQDGLLVEPRNPDALANAIGELLNNKKQRDKLAESGYRTVHENFDITESVDRLESIFSGLVTETE